MEGAGWWGGGGENLGVIRVASLREVGEERAGEGIPKGMGPEETGGNH